LITAEQEWNRAFSQVLPVASLGIGFFSLALTIMSRRSSSALGQRVYYQDGQYLVSVRYPGQWHDLREFITPDDPAVLAVYSQVGQDTWQLFDFVCREISYRHDTGEFWQLARETLARQHADCEDTSILLISLLRNFIDAKVTLGDYQGYGHAWCELNGQILETTYTQARPVPDPENYCPYVLFHDQEVIELWTGALEGLFALRRDEATKLNLMAEAIECISL